MSSTCPREVLKWVLSLNLSFPVKNLKRDFSNGFLVAEVLSRYFPSDVPMHSFENVIGRELKRANWAVIEKLFRRFSIPVERSQIDRVIGAEEDAAAVMLQVLYTYFNSAAYRGPCMVPDDVIPTTCGPSRELTWHPSHRPPRKPLARVHEPAEPFAQDQSPDHGFSCEAEIPLADQQAWQHWTIGHQQLNLHDVYQHQQTALAEDLYNAQVLMYQQMLAGTTNASTWNQQDRTRPDGGARQPQCKPVVQATCAQRLQELAFSRKPRQVAYLPYTAKEYVVKQYDAKRSPVYWELGRLGTDLDTEELQAKRLNQARIKELGRKFTALNKEQILSKAHTKPQRKPATSAPVESGIRARPGRASPSKRPVQNKGSSRKAQQHAKAQQPGQGSKTVTSGAQGQGEFPAQQAPACAKRQHDKVLLEQLQVQHDNDQERVAAIRQEVEQAFAG